MEGIKIKGYTNTWSSITEQIVDDKTYYLMENEVYGDETCYLLVDEDFNVIGETYDDIETALIDENIL